MVDIPQRYYEHDPDAVLSKAHQITEEMQPIKLQIARMVLDMAGDNPVTKFGTVARMTMIKEGQQIGDTLVTAGMADFLNTCIGHIDSDVKQFLGECPLELIEFEISTSNPRQLKLLTGYTRLQHENCHYELILSLSLDNEITEENFYKLLVESAYRKYIRAHLDLERYGGGYPLPAIFDVMEIDTRRDIVEDLIDTREKALQDMGELIENLEEIEAIG